MRFLYRLFLTLTLLGFGFIWFYADSALEGPRIDFDETISLATWAWFFSITCALFAFMFATLAENGRNRRG